MDHDPRGHLWDARESADAIASFVRGRTFEDDRADMMLRSAVERSSGKRCGGSKRLRPISRLRLPERAKAIAFRNILIHGYDSIDDAGAPFMKACRPCARASPRCSTRAGNACRLRFSSSRN